MPRRAKSKREKKRRIHLVEFGEDNLATIDQATHYYSIMDDKTREIARRNYCPTCKRTIAIITEDGRIITFANAHIECVISILEV